MFKKRIGPMVALAVLVIAAGCSDSNTLGPSNQLEVVNQAGTFEWQATALDKIQQTLTYQWTSTDTVANVDQSSSISAGSASVRITDADGTEVYLRGLEQDGTFQTSAGTAGTWTITVVMNDVSGALNFRVDNP